MSLQSGHSYLEIRHCNRVLETVEDDLGSVSICICSLKLRHTSLLRKLTLPREAVASLRLWLCHGQHQNARPGGRTFLKKRNKCSFIPSCIITSCWTIMEAMRCHFHSTCIKIKACKKKGHVQQATVTFPVDYEGVSFLYGFFSILSDQKNLARCEANGSEWWKKKNRLISEEDSCCSPIQMCKVHEIYKLCLPEWQPGLYFIL